MAIRYKFSLSAYIQELLVIGGAGVGGGGGCTGRDLNGETAGSRQRTLAVQ